MRRPCLDCGTPTSRTRCTTCTRTRSRERSRARPTRQAQGYDRAYEQARADLHLEHGPPCVWGCGRTATTADHYPPIQAIGPHLGLVPACQPCNSGHVALKVWKEQQTA